MRNSNRSTLNSTQSTEIELFGADLRDAENQPASVWTSFESTVEAIEPEGTDRGRVRYRITPMNPIMESWLSGSIIEMKSLRQCCFMSKTMRMKDCLQRIRIRLPFHLPMIFKQKGLGYHRIPIELMSGRPFVAEVIGERLEAKSILS